MQAPGASSAPVSLAVGLGDPLFSFLSFSYLQLSFWNIQAEWDHTEADYLPLEQGDGVQGASARGYSPASAASPQLAPHARKQLCQRPCPESSALDI